MAFSTVETRRAAPLAEINMIPFIDIMLVLLVIFMLSAPLLTNTVPLTLPQASAAPAPPSPTTPERLAIDASGSYFWNGTKLAGRAMLREKFAEAARHTPTPELRISADRGVRYEAVAQALADAGKAGLTQVGFETLPGTP